MSPPGPPPVVREHSACSCLTALAPEHSRPWQTLILVAPTPELDFPRLIVVLPSVLLTLGSWPRVLRWPESRLPLVSPDPGSSAIRAPVHLLGSLARGAGCSILLPLDVPCFRSRGPSPLPLQDVPWVCSRRHSGLPTLCQG